MCHGGTTDPRPHDPAGPVRDGSEFRPWTAGRDQPGAKGLGNRNFRAPQVSAATGCPVRDFFKPPVRDFLNGGSPRQRHLGARVSCCRCSLPGLTGFTACRREGTDGGYHKLIVFEIGGEGGIRTLGTATNRTLTFQASPFDHSGTSPYSVPRVSHPSGREGLFRTSLYSTPLGPPNGVRKSFRTILSNPRYGYKPHTHFPGEPVRPLRHLSILFCVIRPWKAGAERNDSEIAIFESCIPIATWSPIRDLPRALRSRGGEE